MTLRMQNDFCGRTPEGFYAKAASAAALLMAVTGVVESEVRERNKTMP